MQWLNNGVRPKKRGVDGVMVEKRETIAEHDAHCPICQAMGYGEDSMIKTGKDIILRVRLEQVMEIPIEDSNALKERYYPCKPLAEQLREIAEEFEDIKTGLMHISPTDLKLDADITASILKLRVLVAEIEGKKK